MGELVFICPTTGKKVPSGIESDLGALGQIPNTSIHVRCPVCGEEHTWNRSDAAIVAVLTERSTPPTDRRSWRRLRKQAASHSSAGRKRKTLR